jgi:ADP-ribose pyrophosphatase YjhB (NUDIX family)
MDLSSHGVVIVILNEAGEMLFIKDARPAMKDHWAPPHGLCEPDTDNTEEDSVKREAFEKVGLQVTPLKKLYTRSADTKAKTVSFWLAKLVGPADISINPFKSSAHGWYTPKDALATLTLYPGTKDFLQRVAAGEILL